MRVQLMVRLAVDLVQTSIAVIIHRQQSTGMVSAIRVVVIGTHIDWDRRMPLALDRISLLTQLRK